MQKETSHQYLVSSHSTSLLDVFFNLDSSSIFSLFKVDGTTEISTITRNDITLIKKLHSDVGMKSSDLLYANAIIWIEGPSDRIYLNKWLDLFCNENKLIRPIEGLDYVFVAYGALWEYLYDIEKINRNSIVIIDKDNDIDNEGKPLNAKGGKKLKIKDTLSKFSIDIIIPQVYSIESFLPKEILIANDIVDNNGHLKKKIRKVKKAEKITSELKVWNLSFNKTSDLQQVISKIHAFIKDNNEIID